MKTRNHENAPRDRAIWIVANIVSEDALGVSVQPFEGKARWNESLKEWVDACGKSVCFDLSEQVHIIEWKELEERALHAPEHEFSVDADVYYWDDEWRRENGKAGFFALFAIYHSPTQVRVADRTEGPFATQGQAMSALATMILNAIVNRPELKEAA